MNENMQPQDASSRITRADLAIILLLTVLWALFFWRVLTPYAPDQASLAEGDFSGQFYAFGAYQARRLLAGEIPLWNPYANGGHPFLADVQAAVFYPPRLFTIFLSRLVGGWSYQALEMEAVAHFWLGSLLSYAFVRRMTGRPLAGLVASLTFTYGGYLTGYPPLQLAVLETAIWLPLVLLGILQATFRPGRIGWSCMVLAGVGLGLCLLAGHPQTAMFTLYLSLAYLAYRLWKTAGLSPLPRRRLLRLFLLSAGVMGAAGLGLAAVQMLPAWEYLQRATRVGLTFDAKAGGFPFQDVAQFLVSDLVSYWSPLYLGLAGLALAMLALWRRRPGALFWGLAALAGLAFSFGRSTVVYHLAYNLLPGVNLFRGQERGAFVVAHSLAILAGLGAAGLSDWPAAHRADARRFMRVLLGAAALIFALAAVLFILWLGPEGVTYLESLEPAAFAALLAALTIAVFAWRFAHLDGGDRRWQIALVALIVFDLFSLNIGRNFEPVPADERPRLSGLVPLALADSDLPFRVDGRVGLGENYGTLVGLQDIYGTSPLRLASHDALLSLPEPLRWQLLGVRYIFSEREALPAPSEIIAQDSGRYLHRLSEAHPMAWLTADPPPAEAGPVQFMEDGSATITAYKAERIVVEVEAPSDAFLTLSEHDYPGWEAMLDGAPVDILRAWGGLRVVAVPAGRHTVEMVYRPASFALGAVISLATLLAVVVVALRPWLRSARRGGDE